MMIKDLIETFVYGKSRWEDGMGSSSKQKRGD